LGNQDKAYLTPNALKNKSTMLSADSKEGGHNASVAIFTDASVLYSNNPIGNKKYSEIAPKAKKYFSSAYDLKLNPKYHKNPEAGHEDLVSEQKTKSGILERVFRSGKKERFFGKLKKV
jgi:hypothetical protein